LIHWEQQAPVVAPGDFGELEVPQSFNLGGRWYLLFCTGKHRAARLSRLGLQQAWNGTHYLVSDSITGPYRLSSDEPLVGDEPGTYYAGRVVEDPDGRLCFMAWRHWDEAGQFLGGLSNPAPIEQDEQGRLTVDKTALWPAWSYPGLEVRV
jgi:beta-fructofuranosidase